MKYFTGEIVEIGDEVELSFHDCGVVVCSIDDDKYSTSFPKNEWQYLNVGVLINSQKSGLVHLSKSNEDLILIRKP